MPAMPPSSSPRTWPWWLWVEHGLVLGFVGWKTIQVWRALRFRDKQPQADTPGPVSGAKAPCGSSSQSCIVATSPELGNLPLAVSDLLERLKALAGSRDVLGWPQVYPAPAATMDTVGLNDGQTVAHHDTRGSIYKFKLSDGVYVNMYYTKAGYRRSGDMHDCNQYDVVLKGRTRLRMIDPHSGREVVKEYGANDFIVIPARTPHMFEFLEDNCLLEWWDAPFKAWYYKPYRSVIEQGLPLTATEDRNFSLSLVHTGGHGADA